MEGYVVTQPEGGRRLHDGWGGITYAPDVDVVIPSCMRLPCLPARWLRSLCRGTLILEIEGAAWAGLDRIVGREGRRSGRRKGRERRESTRKIYDLDLGERGG